MNLIIDIGNTMAKVALFNDGEMVEVLTESNQSLDCLKALCAKYPVNQGIVATVIDLNERVLADLAALPFPLLWLNHETPLPVVNLYETPETLGYDRMAAVVGANEQFPHRNILVIDAGTCITYEFIDSKGQYHGGNISPGMQMRFKALRQFTGRLPLVDTNGRKLPMGRDTETAIRAGVLKGMEYEISGYSVAGNNSGNSRNGSYPKKIQTEHGESVISIPRDRNGQFEPIAVPTNTLSQNRLNL